MARRGSLRIMHVLRAPVGGLFRHVCDLARAQAKQGHAVGIIAAAANGGAAAEACLAALGSVADLGISRATMPRAAGPSDAGALLHVRRRVNEARCDVVHGHGAKGGAYARLAAFAPRGSRPARVYTPHGGSLHYSRASAAGMLFLSVERALLGASDAVIFESRFARDAFLGKVGRLPDIAPVIHNGLAEPEFEPVQAGSEATDLLFLGELRRLKGVDLLLEALAAAHRNGRRLSLTIIGSGPDEAAFKALSASLSLDGAVRFRPPMPARQAFRLGRILVVPSRAESLPYVVLEAIAAGRPVLATRVGGIPEIFGPDSASLLPAGDVAALAEAITAAHGARDGLKAQASRLRERARTSFSIESMVDGILRTYERILDRRQAIEAGFPQSA